MTPLHRLAPLAALAAVLAAVAGCTSSPSGTSASTGAPPASPTAVESPGSTAPGPTSAPPTSAPPSPTGGASPSGGAAGGIDPIRSANGLLECPATHPVEGFIDPATRVKVYRLPVGPEPARTRPVRCFLDARAAEDEGFRLAAA